MTSVRSRVGERAGRLLHPEHHDQPVTTEQGGRQHVGQLAGRQAGSDQLVHLRVGVALEDGGADGGDRPGAQQLLLARDDAQAGRRGRGCGGHDSMLPRAADVPGRAPPR